MREKEIKCSNRDIIITAARAFKEIIILTIIVRGEISLTIENTITIKIIIT